MKRINLLLALILIATTIINPNLHAQNHAADIPVLDSLAISKSVHHFIINNNSIEGEGAVVLNEYISNSKFFVLGEYHHSTEISKLTESLVPLLDRSGYMAAAFEVGPHSADKLSDLAKVPDSTSFRLKDFNAKYYTPSLRMLPIPFFENVYDADFLAAFSRKEMEIWGIDQEFFTSVTFWGDELLASKSKEPNFEEYKAVWDRSKQYIDSVFANFKGDPTIFNGIQSNGFRDFRNMFDAKDEYAQSIFQRLDESWAIYAKYGQSSGDRERYLRSTFLDHYTTFEEKNKGSSYFIKIGSLHAAKTKYQNNYLDIGALTEELAQKEKSSSTNVIVEAGFLNGKDKRGKLPALMNYYQEDAWTIINLKELRNRLNSDEFQINSRPDSEQLQKLIHGFDILMIPPADITPDHNM